MADRSSIEWTEATWNPVRGCSIVSPGCTNCYAMKQAHRFSGAGKAYAGLTKLTKGGPVWTGKVTLHPELLDWPLHKRKPLRIFVLSMSDLFHEDVPDDFIDKVFSTMGQCEDGGWRPHTFQILTKRAERMRDYVNTRARRAWNSGRMNHDKWPMPNVWLGVSVEDQARADERIPLLLQTPAAVRWISAEPLLGPIDLESFFEQYPDHNGVRVVQNDKGLDWVVVGGESGPGARPFDIAWARSLRDQCRAAGVPYFLKQLGRYPLSTRDEGYPWSELEDENGQPIGQWGLDGVSSKGGDPAEWPADLRVREYPR